MQTSVSTFNHTLEQSHLWLKELQEIGGFEDQEEAYSALRAVLQSLRDRLTLNEAAHLAAQMPLLLKGVYYEGWRPEKLPHTYSSAEDFLHHIRSCLRNASNKINPQSAATAVLKLLENKISRGEINHIKSQLPHEILNLWQ